MEKKLNEGRICIREGKVFIDGLRAFDGVACTIAVTPETAESRLLGDKTPSTRWIGLKITASMTRARRTKWGKEVIKKYLDSGETPEFTIQGIMDDKSSDYYRKFGAETVTAAGCVPTGEFNLISLDGESNTLLTDVTTFAVKELII